MNAKIEQFFARENPPTPCLVVDLDQVAGNYAQMKTMATWADIFYAVKANPAPQLIGCLAAAGSSFDAASPAEIEACLAAGVDPTRISFGNTVKKAKDIMWAAARGIELFAVDSEGEVDKLAANAPGARVFCRIAVANDGARWPLSRKFGCGPDEAIPLLERAKHAGLRPAGLSFHVGSQQTEAQRWCEGVNWCAALFDRARRAGIELDLVNIGGGFPVHYGDEQIPGMASMLETIGRAMLEMFGDAQPRVLMEPGRAIVGSAGVIRSEVVLVADRTYGLAQRWVYLDVGRYGGLAETEGEAIRYRLEVAGRKGPMKPSVVAGPTCDSHDVLYENILYDLPADIAPGDIVTLSDTGAYTTTYASVGFNGFAPLEEYYI
ncbi:MAG: type III PLP-dependent enzyme [Proteobacteria bacterium]|nr:type III PLP-dependent enzyme [Pseudomonadota bacterium]